MSTKSMAKTKVPEALGGTYALSCKDSSHAEMVCRLVARPIGDGLQPIESFEPRSTLYSLLPQSSFGSVGELERFGRAPGFAAS